MGARARRLRRRRPPRRPPCGERARAPATPLTVHDRDPDAAAGLLAAGAAWAGYAARAGRAQRLRDHVPALAGRPRRGRERAEDGLLAGLADGWRLDRHEHERPARAAPPRGARGRARRRRRSRRPSRAASTRRRRARSPCSSAATRRRSRPTSALFEAIGGDVFHIGPLGSASVIKVITNMLAFVHLVAVGRGAHARAPRRPRPRAGLRGDQGELRATASCTRPRAS